MAYMLDRELANRLGPDFDHLYISFNHRMLEAIKDRLSAPNLDPAEEARLTLAARFGNRVVESVVAGEAEAQLIAYLAVAEELTTSPEPAATA